MRRTIAVLFIGLALGACRSTEDGIEQDVVFLASDDLEGRATGSDGESSAAAFIAKRFESIGLEPVGASWFQEFPFQITSPHDSVPIESGTGKNVIGWIDNGAASSVLIGAHYDHLGMGMSGGLAAGPDSIHNGADDNASGVAAILEMASQLVLDTGAHANFVFAAFSGEELGLFGSKFMANNLPREIGGLKYMLNYDMVGRLNEERVLVLSGTGTSPAWEGAFERLDDGTFKLTKHESGMGASDHTSFYLNNVPVLHFFTGQHGEYHKPTDDANLVNFAGIQDIADWSVRLVRDLDDKGLAFTKTQDQSTDEVRSFKVTMGVVPDYTFSGTGLRIDGVHEDRPASDAGIEAGDVLLQLGTFQIDDVYDYMEALNGLEPGTTVDATLERASATINRTVTF